jgi:hypothetical protein
MFLSLLKVYGLEFCSKFLDVSLRLQSNNFLDVNLKNQTVNIKIDESLDRKRVLFKQLTWIPNEILKSDLVLFTMIDRVTSPLCK